MIKKNQSKKLPFNIKDMVVYPSHGVGQIIAIEKIEIDKKKLEHYVISMEQNQLVWLYIHNSYIRYVLIYELHTVMYKLCTANVKIVYYMYILGMNNLP